MISFIELHNFALFSEIFFDLRGAHGVPKKLAFLYGENGAGKSNLLTSILFLKQTLDTLVNLELPPNSCCIDGISEANAVNKPSDASCNDYLLQEPVLSHCPKMLATCSLPALIQQHRSIGQDGPMLLKIGFYHQGQEGFYQVKFATKDNAEAVIEEKLFYTLNQRSGVLFELKCDEQGNLEEGNLDKLKLSNAIFVDAKYRGELVKLIRKYWGKHTFLAILNREFALKSETFLSSKLSSNLITALDVLRNITVLCTEHYGHEFTLNNPVKYLSQLDCGHVADKDDIHLLAVQNFLHHCFTQLFSDVKRAYYIFTPDEAGFKYELYFDKVCAEKTIAVPFTLESTGIKSLLKQIPALFSSTLGFSALSDNFGAGLHDSMVVDLFKMIREAITATPEGQFITTTHSTAILDTLKPAEVYVLKADAFGNREVSCVTDFPRTHKNHSMRHRYMLGIYQGVPILGYVDFKELVDETLLTIKNQSKPE